MDKILIIEGDVALLSTLDGEYEINSQLSGEYGTFYAIETQPHPTYTGDYTVIPTVEGRVLETRDKLMTDDVTVTPIPYWETSNIHGTTVYIADELGD